MNQQSWLNLNLKLNGHSFLDDVVQCELREIEINGLSWEPIIYRFYRYATMQAPVQHLDPLRNPKRVLISLKVGLPDYPNPRGTK